MWLNIFIIVTIFIVGLTLFVWAEGGGKGEAPSEENKNPSIDSRPSSTKKTNRG